MDWSLTILNLVLVIGFYEGFHGYLYFRSKGVKKEGKIEIRVLNINEENAIALNSLFFRNVVVFLSDKINERILRHEEGHINQFNYIYLFMIAVAALLPINTLLAIPAILIGRIMLWKMERDADLYAYSKYNVKFESDAERPKSKIDRIKAWLFDSHPPDWVRTKEEYYEKKNSLIKLFIQDLFS
ncbi:MAG: conjugal transfer protein [Thermoprotei archaeon]|nr:conjugal transfer protein [Thermoprotei archaeon]